MARYQGEDVENSCLGTKPESARSGQAAPNLASANTKPANLKNIANNLSSRVRKHSLAILIALCIILLILNIIIFTWRSLHVKSPPSKPPDQILKVDNPRVIPPILWIQSSVSFDSLGMVEAIVAQHQIAIGKKSGFQVRIVDDVSAYDWLAPNIIQKIRRAKHSTQYFIDISELLRLALLIEHGGVFVRAGQNIFLENLDWVNQTANYDQLTLSRLQEDTVLQWCRSKKAPEVLLFYKGFGNLRYYDDDVIIAKQESSLLIQIFNEMIRVLHKGKRPYDSLQSFGSYNKDGVISMQNFFRNLINFKSHYWTTGKSLCKEYGLLSINKLEGSYIQQRKLWIKIKKELLGDKEAYFADNGKARILSYDFYALNQDFLKVVMQESYGTSHKNSIFREIIQAEGNKWLMTPVPSIRNVQYCIISLKPLSIDNYRQKISKSVETLSRQTFLKWKAIYFVKGLTSPVINHSKEPVVEIVNASEWEGLNLQRAATKYCGEKDIGVILDYDESFEKDESLSLMADHFRLRDVFGAFVSTRVKQKVYQPNPNMKFQRKIMQINRNNFKQLAQNFRAFSLHGYRLIPPFDLHDVEGRYYNREMPFYTLVQLATKDCPEPMLQYYLKSIQQKLQIPKVKVYLNNIVIKLPYQKIYSFSSPEYKSKPNVNTLCFGAHYQIQRLHKNLKDYFVLNNGQQFIGGQSRRNLPKLIPKNIHQIWVGNKTLAPYKRLLMDNIKRLHPSYNYTLWGNDNITRQNFPQTYDIIQMLLKFNKVSRKNKMAMVADLMRMEIVYRHGGFYMDTNYHIFKNHTLDNWLTFKAVMPAQMIPNYKFSRDNGFFGCMKGFPNIQRLIDHRYLSQLMFFDWEANLVTGPFYFTHAMQGEEDFDVQILTLPQDYIYPCYMGQNHCIVPNNTPKDKLLFKQTYAYSSNCENIYYWAFGIDFLTEGATWMR